jgi:hypothetical protein
MLSPFCQFIFNKKLLNQWLNDGGLFLCYHKTNFLERMEWQHEPYDFLRQAIEKGKEGV